MCQRIRGHTHLFFKSVLLEYITDGIPSLVNTQSIICSTFRYNQKPGGASVLILAGELSVDCRAPGFWGKAALYYGIYQVGLSPVHLESQGINECIL